MTEEIERHVVRKFEICQRLGKGVSWLSILPRNCCSTLNDFFPTASTFWRMLKRRMGLFGKR